jgi:hypothetical integral membrane protein (TIGR02206 family)
MLENRYYAIEIFSSEWWINNLITTFSIILLLYLTKKIYNEDKYQKLFTIFLGSLLLLRLFWNQWYQYSIGQWNPEWSLPLQLCSFSCILSGILPIIINFNIPQKIKQFMFECLFYWGFAGLYAFITPVYTAGIEGFLYYDFYIAHGGFIFVILYFVFVLGYRLTDRSWLRVFLYSQVLLLFIHFLNIYIGGTANYFYTMEPPIANNPLIIGTYPTHIIMMDLFALLHFYIIFTLINKFSNKNINQ